MTDWLIIWIINSTSIVIWWDFAWVASFVSIYSSIYSLLLSLLPIANCNAFAKSHADLNTRMLSIAGLDFLPEKPGTVTFRASCLTSSTDLGEEQLPLFWLISLICTETKSPTRMSFLAVESHRRTIVSFRRTKRSMWACISSFVTSWGFKSCKRSFVKPLLTWKIKVRLSSIDHYICTQLVVHSTEITNCN